MVNEKTDSQQNRETSQFKLHQRRRMPFVLSWVVFTLVLLTWFVVFMHSQGHSLSNKHERMIFWEGSSLIVLVLLGSLVLVWYTYKDDERNLKLRLFFSTFSHDLKTAITRIRLNAEMMEEKQQLNADSLSQLIRELHSLDLQLENSLNVANLESLKLLIKPYKLSYFVAQLKNEFNTLQFKLSKDAEIFVDERMFKSVLRNVFSNSVIHAGSDTIVLSLESQSNFILKLTITDKNSQLNGLNIKDIDSPTAEQNRINSNVIKSLGFGLSVSEQLMTKMNGMLTVFNETDNYQVVISLKGKLL